MTLFISGLMTILITQDLPNWMEAVCLIIMVALWFTQSLMEDKQNDRIRELEREVSELKGNKQRKKFKLFGAFSLFLRGPHISFYFLIFL